LLAGTGVEVSGGLEALVHLLFGTGSGVTVLASFVYGLLAAGLLGHFIY
jgi:hypothetical protein